MKLTLQNSILLLMLLLLPIDTFSQDFRWGFSFVNNFTINFLPMKLYNNEPFEISDYQYFGKGIENGEGRMRFEPVDENKYKIKPYFGYGSIFFAYERLQVELITNGLQKYIVSFNLIDKKNLSVGLSFGYGHSKVFNTRVFRDNTVGGHFYNVDSYLPSTYNLYLEEFKNGQEIYFKEEKQPVFSTGIYTNIKLGRDKKKSNSSWILLFAKLSVFYTRSDLKYDIQSDLPMLKPGTYETHVPGLKLNSYGLCLSVGKYLWGSF